MQICWNFLLNLPRDLAKFNVNAWKTMFDPLLGRNVIKCSSGQVRLAKIQISICIFKDWSET